MINKRTIEESQESMIDFSYYSWIKVDQYLQIGAEECF